MAVLRQAISLGQLGSTYQYPLGDEDGASGQDAPAAKRVEFLISRAASPRLTAAPG